MSITGWRCGELDNLSKKDPLEQEWPDKLRRSPSDNLLVSLSKVRTDSAELLLKADAFYAVLPMSPIQRHL